jgi:C1A family cysteine protease
MKHRKFSAILLVTALIFVCGLAGFSDIVAQSEKSEDERISEVNRLIKEKGMGWEAGKTSVSHLSDEQWNRLFPPFMPVPPEVLKTMPVITAPAEATYPAAWDWRNIDGVNYVTSVKDQYFNPSTQDTCDCGSCWAFAANAQLESHILIYDGREEDLSEQQMLSCNTHTAGCVGGSYFHAYEVFMEPGAVAESCMPYECSDGVQCIQEDCSIHGRISGFARYTNDQNSIKQALLTGPVWAAIWAPPYFKYYTGGCYWTEHLGYTPNHAVLCIGWDDTIDCGDGRQGAWIIKNSFGTGWGMGGFAYVSYEDETFATGSLGLEAGVYQIDYTQNPVQDLWVKKPNGGEVWPVGSQHTVEWHSVPGVHHFEIGYSNEFGYHVVDSGVNGEIREYVWTIPDDSSVESRIKITAMDAGGTPLMDDVSDEFFAILPPKTAWGLSDAPICTESSPQYVPVLSPDGTDGAIIAWRDFRNGNLDIYAQRIDGNGVIQWAAGGVGICTSTDTQSKQQIVDDGNGGAFLVWEDHRSAHSSIYAQWIDASGVAQWGTGGKRIAAVGPLMPFPDGDHFGPQITSDGSGGAFIAWNYRDASLDYDIYAQRIAPDGVLCWPDRGAAISIATEDQVLKDFISDGSGIATVVWMDHRNGSNNKDIYAQQVDVDGNTVWAINGVAVCTAPGFQDLPVSTSDGAGGVIVAWEDDRAGLLSRDIYAQRIDANGVGQWILDGVLICDTDEMLRAPSITTDGEGGANVVWLEEKYYITNDPECAPSPQNCTIHNIYAQRVDGDGNLVWPETDGVSVCTAIRDQRDVRLSLDGAGGFVAIWRDVRDGDYDVYGQHITSSGVADWHKNGEPLCVGSADAGSPALTRSKDGRLLLSWNDNRNGNSDIFAQKLVGDFSPLPSCDLTAKIVRNGQDYSVTETNLFGCPAGDRGDVLEIKCDFNDDDMVGIPAVNPQDIVLGSNGLPCDFCDPSYYGIPGTPENGWTVTLVRIHIKGCSDCAGGGCDPQHVGPRDIPVSYTGRQIGIVEGLRIKSIDVNGDGVVNGLEASALYQTYNKPPGDPAFNSCYDFNGDGYVNLSDFSFLGEHYYHECPGSQQSPPSASYQSDVIVKFVVQPTDGSDVERRIRVTVHLENTQQVSGACFGVDNTMATLEFLSWTPNSNLSGSSMATPVVRSGNSQLVIAQHGLQSASSGSSIELGTIEYLVRDDGESARSMGEVTTGDGGFAITFGDVVDIDGSVKNIGAAKVEVKTVVFENYLGNCHPNPFNPTTAIDYAIKERGHVTLKVYNVAGQLVRTLVDENQAPSSMRQVMWHGRNDAGQPVSSGVYFYRLVTKGFVETKKMVLLK